MAQELKCGFSKDQINAYLYLQNTESFFGWHFIKKNFTFIIGSILLKMGGKLYGLKINLSTKKSTTN
jgi:hypothetical protein